MKSAVENLSPTRVRISIDVDFKDLEPHVTVAYETLAKQVSIPGFRKGKGPRQLIDQRVGRGTVLNEAINSAHHRRSFLHESNPDALQEHF